MAGFERGSFSVHLGSDKYRENFDRVFRRGSLPDPGPRARPADGPRVVFLDVDGVLVPVGESDSFGAIYRVDPQFDPDCVARLNEVVRRSRARIVVSSTWRLQHELREMRSILRRNGVEGVVLDFTPELSGDAFRREIGRPVMRGDEVRSWLAEQDVLPRGWVILDDDGDFPGDEREHLVRTDPDLGLRDEDVAAALRILGV